MLDRGAPRQARDGSRSFDGGRECEEELAGIIFLHISLHPRHAPTYGEGKKLAEPRVQRRRSSRRQPQVAHDYGEGGLYLGQPPVEVEARQDVGRAVLVTRGRGIQRVSGCRYVCVGKLLKAKPRRYRRR